MSEKREVWITGIGVVSSLGIGIDPKWEALRRGEINVDRKLYAPWRVWRSEFIIEALKRIRRQGPI